MTLSLPSDSISSLTRKIRSALRRPDNPEHFKEISEALSSFPEAREIFERESRLAIRDPIAWLKVLRSMRFDSPEMLMRLALFTQGRGVDMVELLDELEGYVSNEKLVEIKNACIDCRGLGQKIPCDAIEGGAAFVSAFKSGSLCEENFEGARVSLEARWMQVISQVNAIRVRREVMRGVLSSL